MITHYQQINTTTVSNERLFGFCVVCLLVWGPLSAYSEPSHSAGLPPPSFSQAARTTVLLRDTVSCRHCEQGVWEPRRQVHTKGINF